MKDRLTFRSKYSSVYNAFIVEAEAIGVIYNDGYTHRREVKDYVNLGAVTRSEFRCLYLSNNTVNYKGKFSMVLTVSSTPIVFDLDRQFEEALEAIKEWMEEEKNKSIVIEGILSDYNVKVTREGIQVGCQRVAFDKFDILVSEVDKFRKSLTS